MNLNFITDENFKKHIRETIEHYGEELQPFDLKKFNSNIVDPIKLLFDKNIYGFTWEELIKSEIFRQRDKSNNNSIGYFNQNIFRYIAGCILKFLSDSFYNSPFGTIIKFFSLFVKLMPLSITR